VTTTKEIRVEDSTNLKAAARATLVAVLVADDVTIASRRKRWIELTLTNPIAGSWRPRPRLGVT
jgi:hypothetical protein